MKTCKHPDCDQPRKVTPSGTVLQYCAEHQREAWRNDKRDKLGYAPRVYHHHKDGLRICAACKTQKPIEAFKPYGKGYKKVCVDCDTGNAKPGRKAKSPALPQAKKASDKILINTGDKLIVAQILSIQHAPKQAALMEELYRLRGYEVEHVYERKTS